MANKRAPFRDAHLKLANEYVERGQLILGGAYSDMKSADLVFKATDEEIVKKFVESDPYVTHGLVTSNFFCIFHYSF
jgi:uncharacterized protein YciI